MPHDIQTGAAAPDHPPRLKSADLPANVTVLHRGVAPIAQLKPITGDTEAAERMDVSDRFAATIEPLPPTAMFTADELTFACFLSGGVGALLTAAAAYVWSFFL